MIVFFNIRFGKNSSLVSIMQEFVKKIIGIAAIGHSGITHYSLKINHWQE